MKKTIGLLFLSALLTFSLTACGTDTKTTDTAAANKSTGSTVTNGTGSGTAGTTTGTTVPNAGTATGTAAGTASAGSKATKNGAANSAVTTDTLNRSKTNGTTTVRQNALLRPATYAQMLRNARVHDTDGNLRDMENSVTPGTAY
mgnify:CR=1 FL=1